VTGILWMQPRHSAERKSSGMSHVADQDPDPSMRHCRTDRLPTIGSRRLTMREAALHQAAINAESPTRASSLNCRRDTTVHP
jgi:hypothetical protein